MGRLKQVEYAGFSDLLQKNNTAIIKITLNLHFCCFYSNSYAAVAKKQQFPAGVAIRRRVKHFDLSLRLMKQLFRHRRLCLVAAAFFFDL